MSYDIDFRVKVEGADRYVSVWGDANITWNVKKIIQLSTGLSWENESNNGFCTKIIPNIEKGLRELENNPRKYKQYEAKNGWGTVEGTISFFRKILTDWEAFKKYDPELARLAVFWIG